MTVRTNIASGLKSARKAAGLNVDEVGAAVGKSGKTISAWEVGRGQPDGDELIILCKLFGVHLRDFYGDEYTDFVANSSFAQTLTPDEQELVGLYRSTTEFGQHSIMTLAAQLAEAAPRPKPGDFPHLYLSDEMSDEEVDERVAAYEAALEEWTKARREVGSE